MFGNGVPTGMVVILIYLLLTPPDLHQVPNVLYEEEIGDMMLHIAAQLYEVVFFLLRNVAIVVCV